MLPAKLTKGTKMGFGTLFIGYFLLLNLVAYRVTDVIAAAVMLLGLYKLSFVNKYFKGAAIASSVFVVFSLGEFGVSAYEMLFRKIDSPVFISISSVIRCIIVGALTVLILKGIELVSKEVDIPELSKRAYRMIIISAVTYALWIFLEAPFSVNSYILSILSVITIIATIALIFINLSVIYTCYMRICMPGDEDITKQKPSRFAFVNEYRARKAERDAAMMKERSELLRKRNEKRGKKK